jgi:hypothetical protein
VLPPDAPVEPAPQPRPVVPQSLPAEPRGPAPVIEIDELDESELAKFGSVIGMGPAPAPLFIGPEKVPDETPEEHGPVVEPAPIEPTASFRRPVAEMPDDPQEDGVSLHTLPASLMQEQPASPQRMTPQTWPGYRIAVMAPYQRPPSQPTYAPQRPPLRTRVYEVMTWPWRTLTEPFRD